MTIETPAPLVSAREAPRQIPVGRTKLYDPFDRGELVWIKVGARAFVTQRSIDEFVERLAPLKQDRLERSRRRDGARG